MSKDNKKLAFELYVQDLQRCYDELNYFLQFVIFYGHEKYMVEQTLEVYKQLLKKLKNIDSIKDAKELVKIKKLVEKYNLE